MEKFVINYIYRISDKSNDKNKISNVTKMHCLDNFMSVFGYENLTIILDNCEERTFEQVKAKGIKNIIQTNLGNKGSCRFAMDYALANFSDNEFVYFVEDDFLHKPNALIMLREGLEISDYVTLYDHPDKYKNNSDNKYISNGGEVTRVMLSESSHWKLTNSTVMTFAVRVKILRDDYCIWKNFPARSFKAWQRLQKLEPWFKIKYFYRKKRMLISPIPGVSTHGEVKYLSPFTDWTKI